MRTYSLDKADAWLADIAKGSREAALRGLYSAALRTVNYIVTEAIPQTKPTPINRGVYRAAWRARKIKEGSIVQNTLPYASIIEYGARPENIKIGKKMIDALAEWVRMKGIGGRTVAHGKKSYLIKPNPDEARGIAWAIAMSMKKRGIFNQGKGLKIFDRAMKMVPLFMRQEVAREIERGIAK